MLMPKKVKFRKQQRGRRTGIAKGGNYIAFGDFGLQALEAGLGDGAADRGGPYRDHPPRQARRQALDPASSRTSRSPRSRSRPVWARARATPEEWVAVVKPARILYELEGVEPAIAEQAMRLASHKLGIKTRFVTRHERVS